MTLRRRVLLGLVVAVVGAVVAAVQIAASLHQTHSANHAVTDKWAPANSTSNKLLAHLIDQETGERGYVITGDAHFLTPYTQGRAQTTADLTQISALVGSDPAVATALAAVTSQWQAWLTGVAQPEIAARRSGDTAGADRLVDSELNQTVFDRLRADVTTLQNDLSARTSAERARVTAGIAGLERAFLATLIGAVVLALLFAWLLFGAVLRPLEALQHRLRRVTAGAFREPILESGPPELREAARDAELMRNRLLEELETSESAREALEQRGAVVIGLSERLRLTDAPPIPGLRIASLLHPAEGVVAGDLLDVVQVDARHVGLVIADVSGHGAGAGLEAITLKHVVRTALRLGLDPARVLAAAADEVRLDERFATCAVVLLDVVSGELTYANAGHLPPLVIPAGHGSLRAEALVGLEPTGPLLSVITHGWEVGRHRLEPGEILLLVTDGLLEARSSDGVEFGVEGVCAALQSTSERDVEDVVGAVTAAARAHARDYRRDDVTVLAVMLAGGRRRGAASAALAVPDGELASPAHGT